MDEQWHELDPYRGKFFSGKWPTITEMFNITLSRFPGRRCFTTFEPDEIGYSFTEVHGHIQRIASYLIEHGVKKGDKVAINGKNSIQWALAYLSINYAGGVVVPIDNQMHIDRFQTLSEFAEVVYVLADFNVINAMDKESAWFKSLKGMMTLKGHYDGIENIMECKPEKIHDYVRISEDDLAALLFTSGTTGNEKAAMLTNRNIVSDTYLVAAGMGVAHQDTLYALLPLHHSYCCTTVLLETIKHGANCLFGHGIVVSKMIADMKRGGVTVFMGIPLLYNKILNGVMKKIEAQGKVKATFVKSLMWVNGTCKKYFHISPLRGFFNKKILSVLGMDKARLLICGAGPLSPDVFKKYQQFGLDFLQGYGLTECAPVISVNPKNHFKIDSVGAVLNCMDVIIADKNEAGIGEIRIKGPNVTLGYYKDKEHTAELFDENGYLKTGDLATMDSERYLYLKGRAKNLIVTEGGKNVYPEEIEDSFQTYSNIEQILVRGFQQKKDVPCECIEAVIYPSPDYYKEKGLEGNDEEIRKDIEKTVEEVNKTLMAYKKIEKVTIVKEAMEMTTTKKIKRNLVKN